jgi:type I restriction enzyme, S subunit
MKKGWEEKILGEVCNIIGGGTPSKTNSKFYSGEILWATVRDMKYDYIKNTEHKITKEAVKNSSTNIIPKGNVIIATRVGLGKVCMIEKDTAINQDLRGVVPKKTSEILRGYLFRWFKSISCKIEEEGTGATVKGVKLPFIKSLLIPIPPLPEQKRIVKILDQAFAAIDKAKENAKKNLKNAKELFDSYLQNIFTNPGEDWEEKRLGEVCSFLNRGISPKYIEEKGICVLNQKCIRDHAINYALARRHDSKVKNVNLDRLIKLGDVLVNSTGTGTLGRVAQIRHIPKEPTTVDSHVTIVRSKDGMFYQEFFGYILIFIEAEIKKAGEGCGGQTELARTVLEEKFFVRYPHTLTEQKKIVFTLDSLSAETKHLEFIYKKKLMELDELKQSILQKAFAGEL